jgi:hypothetical protein
MFLGVNRSTTLMGFLTGNWLLSESQEPFLQFRQWRELVGGGGTGGRFFHFLGHLGKGEKVFLRGFYLRAGLVDKGVWSSTGSRGKVFAFREKVVGQRLRGPGMIELMG